MKRDPDKVQIVRGQVGNYRISILEGISTMDPPEEGPEYILCITPIGRNTFGIPFTYFSAEELKLLKQVVDHAYEKSLPVVEERDRIAEEAEKNGNFDFIRRHRGGPKVSGLPRASGEHDKVVHD